MSGTNDKQRGKSNTTVDEMNRRFLNSNVGRVYQKDKPLELDYTMESLIPVLRGLQLKIHAFGFLKKLQEKLLLKKLNKTIGGVLLMLLIHSLVQVVKFIKTSPVEENGI